MNCSMYCSNKRRKSLLFSSVTVLFLSYLMISPGVSLGKEPTKKEEPGMSVPILGNEHIESPGSLHVPYNSDPPTSGPHTPYIAPWGIHNAPVPKELQVHNLEDGGVIVQYNCMNCQDLVKKLEHIASQYERIILAPYPGMDTVIALTSWGKIDKLKEFDEKRIIRFINAYIGIDHHPKSEK
jgi:hypothetical protein